MSAALSYATAILVGNVSAEALKTTALVSTAAAVLTIWRGASAARRHTLWLATLIACGMTAVASPWGPALSIRMSAPVAVAAARTIGIEPSSVRETKSMSTTTSIDGLGAGSGPIRAALSETGRTTAPHVPWPAIVALIWLVGVMSILIRLVIGAISVRRAAGRLRRVSDPVWAAELRDVEARLGTTCDIALLWGQSRSVPATFGIRRPTIVVPKEATGWTKEQRHLVMLHEVAHIARDDVATQTAANIICALLWFQPLIWIARWRLRAEAESAADDCVLSAGVPASSYADRLLDFARSSSTASQVSRLVVGSVGMFTSSDLERRFKAMLDTNRSRSSSSRRARRAAAVLAVSIGVVVAGLQIASPATAMPVGLAVRSTATVHGSASSSLAAVASRPNPLNHTIAAILATPLDAFAVGTTPSQVRQPIDIVAQARADLSGTWVADTTSVSEPYRAASLPLTLTVLETEGMVAISMHGRPALSEDGSFIEPTPAISWTGFVPLDGTVGIATLFGGPATGKFVKNENLVTGAWHGDTLVMTTWGPKRGSTVRDSTVWKRVDRLTLSSKTTLVHATTIFIGTRDTLSSIISFSKAR